MRSRPSTRYALDLRDVCSFRWLVLIVGVIAIPGSSARSAEATGWIRPQTPGDPLIWGRKEGLVFGLPCAGGMTGPRGLIRVGIYSVAKSTAQLVNFIAIEPVISGEGDRFSRMAFSELEASELDPGKRGKRLTVREVPEQANVYRGQIRSFPSRSGSVEQLTVPIDVERFTANGAHVFVTASMFSNHPDELRLSVAAYSDSPPIEELTLTATMGNFERLRVLWLKRRLVPSSQLFADYREDNFVEHESYTLDEMLRSEDGGAIALATSDEAEPSATFSATAASHWRYGLPRLTQYWRVSARDIEPDLRIRVNGRRAYWASHDPIPGGIAFENFELRQRYRAGQAFIFGLTKKEPWEMDPPIPHLSSEHGIKTGQKRDK
jgi:hypothetical protein